MFLQGFAPKLRPTSLPLSTPISRFTLDVYLRNGGLTMQLTETQSRDMLRVHGACVTEACDRCGRILGHVRWTILGESGEWCSRRCRDGMDHKLGVCCGCGTPLAGKRRGAMYCGRTCRMRTVRRAAQEPATIVNTAIANKGLRGAISQFGYGDSRAPV
jgi:hypothetical protein